MRCETDELNDAESFPRKGLTFVFVFFFPEPVFVAAFRHQKLPVKLLPTTVSAVQYPARPHWHRRLFEELLQRHLVFAVLFFLPSSHDVMFKFSLSLSLSLLLKE